LSKSLLGTIYETLMEKIFNESTQKFFCPIGVRRNIF